MRRLLPSILALTLPAAAAAQDLSISASVNRTMVSLDDQLALTVTVSGASTSLPEPVLPSLPNFNVHSAGRSQNISFVNGVVSSSVQYTYVLVPRFAGKAVIEPITVSAGGVQARTEPIEISVVKHEAPPGGGASPGQEPAPRESGAARAGAPDLFVTAEVDKQKPYVNEQVLFKVRFHTAVPLLGNAEWVPPSVPGFLVEDLPPAPQSQAVIQGRRYAVYEVRLALFPNQAGKLTIGPGAIRCQVQADAALDPSAPDFFQRFFASGLMAAQTKEIRTKAITLEALPLPAEGKPAGFAGAVGRYEISSAVDTRSVKTGDAVNLTVTVKGTGNLKALGELPYPAMDSFRLFETVSSLNLDKDSSGVKGNKVYKTVIVPKVSGALQVPSIPFSYFDPGSRRYVATRTDPIDLQVAQGAAQAPLTGYTAAPGAERRGITSVSEDIRYIKPRLGGGVLPKAILRWAKLGTFHLIPVLIFLAALALHLVRFLRNQNPAAVRFRGALPRAQDRIKKARELSASDAQAAAAALDEALSGFLADKLNQPVSALTRRQAKDLLKKRFSRVPESQWERMNALWQELEALRFAPVGSGAADGSGRLADDLLRLLESLEGGLK